MPTQFEHALKIASDKLTPTTAEDQNPRFEWPCEDEEQMETRLAELIAARDRNREEFGRVQITSFADPSNEKYAIHMWKLAETIH